MRAKALSVAARRKRIVNESDELESDDRIEASPMKPKDRGKLAASRKESR